MARDECQKRQQLCELAKNLCSGKNVNVAANMAVWKKLAHPEKGLACCCFNCMEIVYYNRCFGVSVFGCSGTRRLVVVVFILLRALLSSNVC